MFHVLRCSLLLFLLAAALRAEGSLENAFRAQRLLGPEVWSQVITIQNETRGGTYPRTVHALVFELAGLLWFYTDLDGTQSFSLHHGRLAEEKADFGPLLRDIDPGFVRWSLAPPVSVPWHEAPLLNGCFIESVVGLRHRLARGTRVQAPRLLSYYPKNARARGHTVLAYEVGDVIEVFDPARPTEQFVFGKPLGADAAALARALEGRPMRTARYLSLPLSDPAAGMLATAGEGSLEPDSRAGRDGRPAVQGPGLQPVGT